MDCRHHDAEPHYPAHVAAALPLFACPWVAHDSRNAAIGVSANTSRPVSSPIVTANPTIPAATATIGIIAGTNGL